MFANAKVSRCAVGFAKKHGEVEAGGSAAQPAHTRFDKHKGDVVNAIPPVYPKCCLCLSALLRKDKDGHLWAHLPYFAYHAKQVVLKTLLCEWWHFQHSEVGVSQLVQRKLN